MRKLNGNFKNIYEKVSECLIHSSVFREGIFGIEIMNDYWRTIHLRLCCLASVETQKVWIHRLLVQKSHPYFLLIVIKNFSKLLKNNYV